MYLQADMDSEKRAQPATPAISDSITVSVGAHAAVMHRCTCQIERKHVSKQASASASEGRQTGDIKGGASVRFPKSIYVK